MKIAEMLSDIEDSEYDNEKVVLYMDSMHPTHNTENDYAWQERGKAGTVSIKSNSGRKRLTVLGALNPVTLNVTSIVSERNCNQDMMKNHLEQIKKEYIDAKNIVIYLDNASYNRAYAVQAKAEKLGITLNYLPAYSPNLNLIERVWRFLKKEIIKNRYYEEFKTFFYELSDLMGNITYYHDKLKSLLALNFQIITAL